MGDIIPEQTADGRLLLKFKDGSFRDPFIDKYVSDGTIKMFAYLVLLHDPKPHALLCVEEPENQLYPRLLIELAEEFREYARRGGQVFVSTHSPDFLNAVHLEEVFWLSKDGGFSKVQRAKDDPQLDAFMQAGDQMGYLWKEGFLKGLIQDDHIGFFLRRIISSSYVGVLITKYSPRRIRNQDKRINFLTIENFLTLRQLTHQS